MRAGCRRGGVGSRCVLVRMVLVGNLPKVQTISVTMAVFWWFEQRWSVFWAPLWLWATGDRATRLHPPVNTVDTAGFAETFPNFARNSLEYVLDHALNTAEYQRFDFKV